MKGSRLRIISQDGDSVVVKRKGVEYTVTHFDEYGVLVVGSAIAKKAFRVLVGLGYDPDALVAWRPLMVRQSDPAPGRFGSAYGGEPAVAFYFEVAG